MLTTIGDKIVEIRPKQIIQSSKEIKNPYLSLVKSDSTSKRGRLKVDKNAVQCSEQSPELTETNN